jgi:hypothetical protein
VAPAPPAPAPVPIQTEPPSAAKAQVLAQEIGRLENKDEKTLDEDKYLETWKHPAMSDVTHGLTAKQADEFTSKIGPDALSILNAPVSPSTRPLWLISTHVAIGFEMLCIEPIVTNECNEATFSLPTTDGGLVNPKNVSTQRFNAGKSITSNVLDAYGHCFDGCRVAQQCGPLTQLAWGREREAWREAGYAGPHDSFPQDVHNEARGLLLYMTHQDGGTIDCAAACADAVDTLLDLSAPVPLP